MPIRCFVARDHAGGLVGFYKERPQEVITKTKSKTSNLKRKYFIGSPGTFIYTMTYLAFTALFNRTLELGECQEMQIDLKP